MYGQMMVISLGDIFTFGHFGKIFKVTRNKDLKKLKPVLDTRRNFSSV